MKHGFWVLERKLRSGQWIPAEEEAMCLSGTKDEAQNALLESPEDL